MQKQKIIIVFTLIGAGIMALLLFKNVEARTLPLENSTLLNEFKKLIPIVQRGEKSISIYQGEKIIQSGVREIEFGEDYFMVRDSVWNGRRINIRKTFIRTDEIIRLIEDETAIVLKLKN